MAADTRAAADGSDHNPPVVGTDPPPVPADTLPFDPESGSVPAVPDHTPDTNAQDVPANVLYQLAEVERGLRPGIDAAEAGVGEWLAAVAGGVDGGVAEVHAIVGGVAGGVLARTDEVHGGIARILDGSIRGLSKRLSVLSDEVRQAGVDIPYDPGVWAMLVETDPGEWLPHLVPEIGAAVGISAPAPNLGPDCTKFPDDPACGGVPPAPPFPPGDGGTVVIPVGNIVCWDGTILPEGASFDDCPPRSPSPPIDPPTIPPPSDGSCPQPVCCDPAPINISVPPPTVVVAPAPPGGPTSPGQTCPAPLQDINFNPEIKVNVNVPPDGSGDFTSGAPASGEPKEPPEAPSLDWSNPYACRDLTTIISAMTPPTFPGDPLDEIGDILFEPLFQSIDSAFIADMQQPMKADNDGRRGIIDAIMSAPGRLLHLGEQMVTDVLSEIGGPSVPNGAAAGVYGAKLAAAGWAERQTSFPLTYLMQAEQYAFQYANPQYLPSQTQIDSMYVMHRIDEEQWTCWTRAHGNIPDIARKYRDSLIAQPSLHDLTQLRLRKELTRDEYYDAAAKIGWRNPSFVSQVFSLATQLPTQSDLLRMMVRDAADEDVVKKYDYDKGFDRVFTGKLAEWSEAQGVPAEIFRYSWRAHWVIPSNTQLYEMYHRLRPDREDVKIWDHAASTIAPELQETILGPRPPVVEIEDVRTALEVNDQAPYWVDKQIAISYHPITRTDAIRAYSIGAFSESKLYESMLDNGYNPADARTLTDYYVSQTVRSNSNATGVLTLRKISRLYKDGALSRAEALEALTPIMVDPKMREQLIARIDLEWKAELKSDRLKGMRKRYVAGEPMAGGWLAQITAVTGDAMAAQRVLDSWNVAYSLRLRESSALMLCKWYKHNVIGLDDYLDRLTNLGYTLRDAEKIAAVCDQEKRQALAKEVERRTKELATAAEKRIKYLDKLTERQCHPPKPCWDGSTPPPPRA